MKIFHCVQNDTIEDTNNLKITLYQQQREDSVRIFPSVFFISSPHILHKVGHKTSAMDDVIKNFPFHMSGVAKDRNKYLCSCETLFIRCLTIFL